MNQLTISFIKNELITLNGASKKLSPFLHLYTSLMPSGEHCHISCGALATSTSSVYLLEGKLGGEDRAKKQIPVSYLDPTSATKYVHRSMHLAEQPSIYIK